MGEDYSTLRTSLLSGIPDILPNHPGFDDTVDHAPNRRQVLDESGKRLAIRNALRYFNPIGAHKSAKIGELPIGMPQNLIPYVTQTGIGIQDKLSIFGNDYPTPDGTCIRDYIHVVDLAKAHVVAMKRLTEERNIDNFEVYNIGTRQGSSVLEVVNTFQELSGVKLQYSFEDRRAGDIISSYADTRKANTVLGWKAELTLKDALHSAWEWEKSISLKNN